MILWNDRNVWYSLPHEGDVIYANEIYQVRMHLLQAVTH